MRLISLWPARALRWKAQAETGPFQVVACQQRRLIPNSTPQWQRHLRVRCGEHCARRRRPAWIAEHGCHAGISLKSCGVVTGNAVNRSCRQRESI